MPHFYDQDNPTSKRESVEVARNNDVVERVYTKEDLEELNRIANNISKKSTLTPSQKMVKKMIREQRRNMEIRRRIAAVQLACLIIGGIGAIKAIDVINKTSDSRIVYEQTTDFSRNVIGPNTHRTSDGRYYYYYDYDDIAKYITSQNRDFGIELYKTYASLGLNQTNKVLEYTRYSDMNSYVHNLGYESIKEWEKDQRGRLIEQQKREAEMAAMQNENSSRVESSAKNSFTTK